MTSRQVLSGSNPPAKGACRGWAEVRHSVMPRKRGRLPCLPSVSGSWAPRCARLLGRSAGVALGGQPA